MISEEMIGPRVRQLRVERGMTQEVLGKAAGLTKGHISRIENSPSSPAVSTLMKLARAMGIGVDAIFAEDAPEKDYCLIRKSERQVVARRGSSHGYSYEPLALQFPNRHMDPYILRTPVEVEKSKVFCHKGEEMVFLLKGRLRMVIGEHTLELDPGDCLYFDSSIPHRDERIGDGEVEQLVVFYSPDEIVEES